MSSGWRSVSAGCLSMPAPVLLSLPSRTASSFPEFLTDLEARAGIEPTCKDLQFSPVPFSIYACRPIIEILQHSTS
jgi:hypothetical protein